MNDNNIKNKTVSGLIWRFMERCGAQGVNFVVSIILARLLAPELYGTIALITVFTAILEIFVDSGMGNALIQTMWIFPVYFTLICQCVPCYMV